MPAAPALIEWLTVALVLITGLYCFFTFKIVEKNSAMVEQMRAQYEAFIAPSIVVNMIIKYQVFICLKIRNNGQSPAKNLRLSLDRDFYQYAEFEPGKNIRNFPPFNEIIPSFAPGEEIFLQMVQGFDLGQTRDDTLITPREFKVSVDYDFGRGHVHQDHEVNLGAYFQTGQDRSEILEELEKIRKVLEKKLGPGS